jgi:glutamyl-tRNA(Gln) amidotransferase subunit D
MPHHGFSGEDILTLKLDNGYNVGIASEGLEIALLAKGSAPTTAAPRATPGTDLPAVAFLGTGGTIASFVDYRTGAVHPAVTAEDLVFSVPELARQVRPRARVLFSLYSENLKPEHWETLAREIVAELATGVAGVIVPHGTDTLGYTAAALAFLLRDLPGPVVLVGSQRSSDRPSSDAALNLMAAARVATADLGEVVAVMHEGTSDERCAVHRGTKVRKLHTSRRDAFRSVNAAPLGWATANEHHLEGARPRSPGPARVEGKLDHDVALVHVHPGLRPDWLAGLLDRVHGAVLAGTGLGHVPRDLVPVVRDAAAAGKPVVLASQCLFGRVDLEVYDSGRDLLAAGAIPASDMLPETALVKLMWALGTRGPGGMRAGMVENVAGEINERLRLGDFP